MRSIDFLPESDFLCVPSHVEQMIRNQCVWFVKALLEAVLKKELELAVQIMWQKRGWQLFILFPIYLDTGRVLMMMS